MTPSDFPRGTLHECSREQELLEALGSGTTLEEWDADLRTHAESCAICREIVTVALPLLQEHRSAIEGAHPPSSGVVWWRAQMRARQEAARAATRPITVFQGVAAAASVAMIVMLLNVAAPTLSGWLGGLTLLNGVADLFVLPEIDVASLKPTTSVGIVLAGACVLCLLLGPLAVYFAVTDE